MITPAYFEDIMEGYKDRMDGADAVEKKDIRKKALKDVDFILKQHGYDSGAKLFEEVMKDD